MNNNITQRQIEAYAHWQGISEPMRMGLLSATISRGKEIFSFSYDNAWLKSNHAAVKDGCFLQPMTLIQLGMRQA